MIAVPILGCGCRALAKTGLVLSLFALLTSATFGQEGSQQTARSKKRAIVIGVELYTLLPRLSFSIDDARAFSDLLLEHMGFDRQDIVLLTDGRDQSARPTRENVFGAIDSLANNPTAVPSDLFVLYFSGHGVARDGQDYLLPSDVGSSEAKEKGVSLQSVVARLAQLDITNVLIVADACRTGESGEFGLSIRELCSELNIGLLLSCKPGARTNRRFWGTGFSPRRSSRRSSSGVITWTRRGASGFLISPPESRRTQLSWSRRTFRTGSNCPKAIWTTCSTS